MDHRLFWQALGKYLAGLAFTGGLLFLPAGTWGYGRGWLFLGLLFIPMLLLGILLFCKAPALLQKRLQNKEQAPRQKRVVRLSLLMFLAGFILAGLDHRFGWSAMPPWITLGASLLLLLSYGLYGAVMAENAYLSRTVEIQAGQKVVDTGLYAIVRHPMYAATLFLFLSFPLVLGSWPAFCLFLAYPFLLVRRIRHEEALLQAGLPGYAAYMQRVKYRMLPFIW